MTTGFIDLQWSPHVSNLLACSAEGGRHVFLVDLRVPSNRVQQNSTNAFRQSGSNSDYYTSSLQWCPWAGSSHYLAGMQKARDAKNTVFVWDIRKGTHQNVRDSPEQILVPSSGKISSFCWSEYAGSPSIVVGTATGAVEEWKLGQGLTGQNPTGECEYVSNTLLSPGKKVTAIMKTASEFRVFIFSTLNKRHYSGKTQSINISNDSNTMFKTVLESSQDIVGMKLVTNGQYSKLLALTADAQLHTMNIVESDTNAPSALPKHKPPAGTKVKSKFSISSLRNISPDELEKRVSASRSAALQSPPNSDYGMPLKPVVVGPNTFRNLIDCESLKGIISQYEGLKLSNFDQFSRRITLQMMVPAIDCTALMRGNITYASFLSSTTSAPLPKQPIDLIVCFPIKFVNFWSPTFIIENKTSLEVCKVPTTTTTTITAATITTTTTTTTITTTITATVTNTTDTDTSSTVVLPPL